MKNFDIYEFAGILTPGAIVLFGIGQLHPSIGTAIATQDISFGGLGIFVILAYAAGQLIQAAGNWVENGFWKLRGGWPSDWIRTNKADLLSEEQFAALKNELASKLGLSSSTDLSSMSDRQWRGITRQVYAAVAAEGRATRIDAFNKIYGLNRGIAASLLVLAALAIASHWWVVLLLILAAVVALYRMNRFAVHYARELFVQFLQIETSKTSKAHK